MWFTFHMYVFIVRLDHFRCQVGALTQFALRHFFYLGDIVCHTSQLFDQDTKKVCHSIQNRACNALVKVFLRYDELLRYGLVNLKMADFAKI